MVPWFYWLLIALVPSILVGFVWPIHLTVQSRRYENRRQRENLVVLHRQLDPKQPV